MSNSVEPVTRFNRWFRRARDAQDPMLDIAALATADSHGEPAVRFVLLKQADRRGFVFYTDKRSRKGQTLDQNPRAALAFYWDRIDRQVRIEGPVEQVSDDEADAYWASRERESQLSASISTQSARVASRAKLVSGVTKLRRSLGAEPIARPGYWTGFRIRPEQVEFWTRGAHRLHRRELFIRTRKGWDCVLLQP